MTGLAPFFRSFRGAVEGVDVESGEYRRGGCRSSARLSCAATSAGTLSLTAGDGDVLFAIQLECNRRTHPSSLARRNFPQNFSLVRRECTQSSVAERLKNEIAGGSKRPSANAPSALNPPALFLSDDIPRNQPGAGIDGAASRQSWTRRCGWRWRR